MAQIRRRRPGGRVERGREAVATATITGIVAGLVAVRLARVIVGRCGHEAVYRGAPRAVRRLVRGRRSPDAVVLGRVGNVCVDVAVVVVRRLRMVRVAPLGLAWREVTLDVELKRKTLLEPFQSKA